MKTATFNIPNINCNHCVHTIETELSEIEGVTNVAANSVTKEVEVQFKDPANEDAIMLLLAEINYPVID